MTHMYSTKIYSDLDTLLTATADTVSVQAARAIEDHGRFTIALAGGSTPQPLYAMLTREPYVSMIDWSKVYIFFGDERCVPPDDPQSNFAMVYNTLLERVPIPPQQTFRMAGELAPTLAAERYEKAMRTVFGDELPRFDMMLLGMGEDGHTASLFPETAAIYEAKKWVVANFVPKLDTWRITLTLPVLNNAALLLMLVAGASKAETLRAVMQGPPDTDLYPVEALQPTNGQVWWYVDGAAAKHL